MRYTEQVKASRVSPGAGKKGEQILLTVCNVSACTSFVVVVDVATLFAARVTAKVLPHETWFQEFLFHSNRRSRVPLP